MVLHSCISFEMKPKNKIPFWISCSFFCYNLSFLLLTQTFFKKVELIWIENIYIRVIVGRRIFVRMLQGLVERLVDVSMSLTKISSRLDFFFFIVYLPGYVFNSNYCVLDKLKGYQNPSNHIFYKKAEMQIQIVDFYISKTLQIMFLQWQESWNANSNSWLLHLNIFPSCVKYDPICIDQL